MDSVIRGDGTLRRNDASEMTALGALCGKLTFRLDITSAPSLAVFGRRLKTELFRRCYNAA